MNATITQQLNKQKPEDSYIGFGSEIPPRQYIEADEQSRVQNNPLKEALMEVLNERPD